MYILQDARDKTQQTVSTSIINTENVYNEYTKGGKTHTNTQTPHRILNAHRETKNNPYH
jgi:hypothetical protein